MTGRRIPIGLSTSSVFPEPAERAFEMAAELGYDGVEVLVTAERATQHAQQLSEWSAESGVPVLSIHSPCLLVTARVWGTDPVEKASRSVDLAVEVGARTVVVHPPFVWQRTAAASFREDIGALCERSAVRVAVENMFPVRVFGALVNSYRPHWNPVPTGYPWYTLDLSHAAAAGVDALGLAGQMGSRLAHVHLADGSGAVRDEHLVPGRGIAGAERVLESLARGTSGRGSAAPGTSAPGTSGLGTSGLESLASADGDGFDGAVVVEVSTQNRSVDERRSDLAEALAFARLHLGQ